MNRAIRVFLRFVDISRESRVGIADAARAPAQ
jgi:hypothetical protein